MFRSFGRLALAAGLAMALGLTQAASVRAQSQSPSLIRDAEIESIIAGYAAPIFAAAGLSPDGVKIYIVDSDTINAFVAGGSNLFIFTGLLSNAQTANEVIGVIAHETGHIAGGHLVRTQDAIRRATAEAILSYILGIGAAVAAGNSQVGAAVIGAGQSAAIQGLLRYSRTQETSADNAGLSYLEQTGQSARGLLAVLELLRRNAILSGTGSSSYLTSHPLTQERIAYIESFVSRSVYSDTPDSPELAQDQRRMRAKLIGFQQSMNEILRVYPESDQSFDGRYARAIGFYRSAQLAIALPLIDGLLAEEPENPYLHELKGQMLFESGQVAASIEPYRRAVELAPTEPLLRLGLAQSEIEMEDAALNKDAIRELTEVVRYEPNNAVAWRLLSIAYGRDGNIGMTALALAETNLLRGKLNEAIDQAERAMRLLPEGTPDWIRAEDILIEAQRKKRL